MILTKRSDYERRYPTDKYNPLPRPIYKHKVNNRECDWYKIDISDAAKYPGEYTILCNKQWELGDQCIKLSLNDTQ